MTKRTRLAALAASVLLIFSFSACAVDMSNTSSTSETSSQAEPTPEPEVSVDESKLDDNLDGLEEYMQAKKYISGTPTDMDASFIGAKEGVKYISSFEGSNNITIELYEYDINNLNETAQTIIDSVKKDGKFELMGMTADAVLSDSGKYLMVYKDSVGGEVHDEHAKKVKEAFKSFKK